MNNQHIVKEYDDYYKKYKSKYGEKTVLLMQIGSFFEMCSIIEENNKLGEQNIYKICDEVLNVLVGNKTYKSGNEKKPYLMGGFPLISQEKYLTYLLNHNYTVVLVEQVTEPPSPERKVTRILSPGTNIEYNKKQNNFLLSIFIEKYSYNNNEYFECGLSAIDLSTGKNFIHNIDNKIDNSYFIDEISRLINFYNPSELIFHTNNYNLSIENILNNWDINHDCFRINHYKDNNYKKPSYQENLLNEYFKKDNMINILKYLNLDNRSSLRLSYVYMLLYVKEHAETILNNIEEPKEYLDNNYLLLTSNSIRQLNLINNYSYYKGKNESLLAICNICETPMGKRMFKDCLLYPLIDKNKIQERYDIIDIYRKNEYYNNVREYLKNIQDLEKSIRLMSLEILQPYDLLSMQLSYEYVNKLLKDIKNHNIYKYYKNYENEINEFYKFRNRLLNIFNFNNIINTSITKHEKSIFKKDVNKELDNIDNKIDETNELMNEIAIFFSKLVDSKSTDYVKITQKDKDKDSRCWLLYCTTNRSKILENKIKKLKKDIKIKNYKINPTEIKFKIKDTGNRYIILELMNELSKNNIKNLKELSKLNKKYYDENIQNIYVNYSKNLKNINKLISEIDILSCGAKISIDNNYCKPILLENNNSSLDIKGIRHPIVEKINTKTEYVTNDIKLENDGILLFGTNACGKSTFMKAVGLNLILAQAGLYVACSEFKFVPYTQIFTRILNNDNIFKSESTFAVEMNELRGIMQRADNKSLVLGDELCSGTETTSALSIVYAGLHTLSNKKSTYIFTSHLHQLSQMNILEDIKNLKIYHLQIKYDNNILIYDRKLKEGPGPSIYGITVCEALGLSKEFVDLAKKIKNKIENKDNNIRTSIYNKNIIVDKCKICDNKAEETHHINEQCNADKNGNIKHFHKNINHNLVPLCKKCHLDTTHGSLIINGYIETSNGIKLDYFYNNNKKSKKNIQMKI